MEGHYKFNFVCPHCKSVNDCAKAIKGDSKPDDGSILICAYCACVLVINNGLARSLNEEEWVNLPTEELQVIAKAQTEIANGQRYRRL
jgi:hypothetical protein